MGKTNRRMLLQGILIFVCIILVLSTFVNVARIRTVKGMEYLNWQMEHLDVGESFRTPTRNCSFAVQEIEKQLKDSTVMAEKIIEFGNLCYRLVDYKHQNAIEQIYLEIDNQQYQIEIGETQYERPHGKPYYLRTITFTRLGEPALSYF